MDIDILVKLTTRAWSLGILALMHAGTSARQANLISALGAGRTAFGHSLAHLMDLGLVERNPGHGHPLRPEYRLTPEGARIAGIAYRTEMAVLKPNERALLRRAWTVPILVVSREPRQFRDIKSDLVPISDRALSQSLKRLQTRRWIQRTVDTKAHPPRPLYQAVNTGVQIAKAFPLGQGRDKRPS